MGDVINLRRRPAHVVVPTDRPGLSCRRDASAGLTQTIIAERESESSGPQMAIHRLTDLRVGTVTNLNLMAWRHRDGDVTDDDQAPAPRAGRPKPLGHHCLRFPGLTIELDSTMQSFMGARTEHLGFFENLCRDRQNYAPLFTAADRNPGKYRNRGSQSEPGRSRLACVPRHWHVE